jgi:CO/xanthine dehydrogenase FAD-binding subunit
MEFFMITEYYRPHNMEAALILMNMPNIRPLGGGTTLSHPGDDSFAVLDLQNLGLDKIHKSGNMLTIGATVTLQELLESPHAHAALKAALKLETPLNIRNIRTVAGALVTCNGRSPFAVVMLAMEAALTLVSEKSSLLGLDEILPLRQELLHGKLITEIAIPTDIKLAYESVARSPVDKPIVCAALAKWPSGRMRLVIGGWGKAPTLAMDGNEDSTISTASMNAAYNATDKWASADYRSNVAAILAKRCQENLSI